MSKRILEACFSASGIIAVTAKNLAEAVAKTNKGLEKSCPGAKLMAGKLLNGVFITEMKTWAESVL